MSNEHLIGITFSADALVAVVGEQNAEDVPHDLLEAAAAGLIEQIRPAIENMVAARAAGAVEAARRSAFEETHGGDEQEVINVMTLLYSSHSVRNVTRAAAAAEGTTLVRVLAEIGLEPSPAVAEAVRRLAAS